MSSVADVAQPTDRRIIVGMRGRTDLVGRVVVVESYPTQKEGRLRVRLVDGEDQGPMSIKEEHLMTEEAWALRREREQMLTKGCIPKIFGEGFNLQSKPVVQLISIDTRNMNRTTNTRQERERIKCHLSDGKHYGVGVLTPEVAALVLNQTLREHMLVRLTLYMISVLAGSKICLIMGLEIACAEQGERMGIPKAWDASGNSASTGESADASGSPGQE